MPSINSKGSKNDALSQMFMPVMHQRDEVRYIKGIEDTPDGAFMQEKIMGQYRSGILRFSMQAVQEKKGKEMIDKKDLGWKEIVMNLDDGIVITLTVAGLKQILKDEEER